MPEITESKIRPVLDPMDRISEILFGLIMVLGAALAGVAIALGG
jgi:hypothetical protein